MRKVILDLGNNTTHADSFLRLSIAFVAITVSLLVTGCQSITETTVKTKSAANEAAAIAALRTVSSAETAYAISHDGNYGSFEELVKAGNLDTRFSGDKPVLGGYVFSIKTSTKDSTGAGSYSINADPQQDVAAGSRGVRHLYMDSTDNAIRVNAKQSASSSDPQL